MADTKLTAVTEMVATPAIDDVLYIADVSEGTAGSRRIESRWFWRTDGNAAYVSGGGTVALGGYILTAPATGTVVTLDATQTLTNKSLTAPTIGTPTITGGTATGIAIENATFAGGLTGASISASTFTGGTIAGAVALGGTVTGGVLGGTPTIEMPVIGTPTVTGGTFISPTIGTPTVTGGTFTSSVINSATLDAPTVTGGTLGGTPTLEMPVIGTPTVTGGTINSSTINTATLGTPTVSGGTFTSPQIVQADAPLCIGENTGTAVGGTALLVGHSNISGFIYQPFYFTAGTSGTITIIPEGDPHNIDLAWYASVVGAVGYSPFVFTTGTAVSPGGNHVGTVSGGTITLASSALGGLTAYSVSNGIVRGIIRVEWT